MSSIKLLILEDDLLTLSKILGALSDLEEEFLKKYKKDFSVVILSEYTQVEKYINSQEDFEFDLVLLDRDCKAGGSFHVLDFNKPGIKNIIGISSVPEYNQQLIEVGIDKIIHKDYQKLDSFSIKLMETLETLIVFS